MLLIYLLLTALLLHYCKLNLFSINIRVKVEVSGSNRLNYHNNTALTDTTACDISASIVIALIGGDFYICNDGASAAAGVSHCYP